MFGDWQEGEEELRVELEETLIDMLSGEEEEMLGQTMIQI
jgi:hypothetical protein